MRRASLVTNSQVVARGTVTKANMRISAVDGGATASGGAFVDFGAADVLTGKIGHLLKIYDSSKRVIQGYIKAGGTGETLSGEAVVSWTNIDFSSFASSGTDITLMVSSGGGNNCIGAENLTSGRLYSGGFTGSRTEPVCGFRNSRLTSLGDPFITIKTVVSGAQTYKFTAIEQYIGFIGSSAFNDLQISSFSLKQVLTPSATGVTITSQKGNATYNWAAKQTSFNYNDASGYTYEILKVYDLKEVSGFGGAGLTASQQHVSIVTANAFFFSDGLDFTPYLDGRHYLRLKDAAGIVSWGKIKGQVSGGETFQTENY